MESAAGLNHSCNAFGDEPDGPQFYNMATIIRQNELFQNMFATGIYDEVESGGLRVEPNLAILIGDLGADMPIALDYRLSRENPRVIYLGPHGWAQIADDFGTLLRLLEL